MPNKGLDSRDAILFSFVHGSFLDDTKFNDIDVAIYIDEKMVSKDAAMDFEFNISNELEDIIEFPVDVKIINYAPLGFQYHATSGKILTCKDSEFMVDKVAEIRILYLDFKLTSNKLLLEMLIGNPTVCCKRIC